MQKDPQYVFDRHEKLKNFDVKSEDVLQAILEQHLL